jgi:phosphatidate cytidylyltransferase
MSEETAPLPKSRSDLGTRTASGVVMMIIAIGAIWLGGYAFMALVVAVGLGVLWEFSKLAFGFVDSLISRMIWFLSGIFYVGIACFALLILSSPFFGASPATILIAGVIGTDVGAYFAGRTFGGPKIAPHISPSKTWSGLLGGMLGAGLLMNATDAFSYWIAMDANVQAEILDEVHRAYDWFFLAVVGAILAVVAQAGDFFESWMKRRAGVKDSGHLIPGHGGLFDRTDGLIAVAFCAGLIFAVQFVFQG